MADGEQERNSLSAHRAAVVAHLRCDDSGLIPPDCWPVCEYGVNCPHEWRDRRPSPDTAADRSET